MSLSFFCMNVIHSIPLSHQDELYSSVLELYLLSVFQKYFRSNVKNLFPGHGHACTGWGLFSLGVPAQRVDLKSESPLLLISAQNPVYFSGLPSFS